MCHALCSVFFQSGEDGLFLAVKADGGKQNAVWRFLPFLAHGEEGEEGEVKDGCVRGIKYPRVVEYRRL